MIACPLCNSETVIRIPSSLVPDGRLFHARKVSRPGGYHGQEEIDPKHIHMIRGENCWANGVQAYRGVRRRYCGTSGSGRIITEVVTPNWQPLTYGASYDWGTLGDSSAQLAKAILLDHLDDEEAALEMHQLFKNAYVSCWGDVWQVTLDQLRIFTDEVYTYWREHQQEQAQEVAQAMKENR